MSIAKAHTWTAPVSGRCYIVLREDGTASGSADWDSMALELLKVVAERDRALEALADLRGVSINSILEEWRNE